MSSKILSWLNTRLYFRKYIMSAMERALGGQKLECILYIKFKKGDIAFTLRDLFKEAALAKMDSGIAVVLLQNVTKGQLFTITPDLVDKPNLDDEYRIILNPLLEENFVMKYDGVLKAILDSLEAGIVHQSLRKPIEDALVEKDNLKKIFCYFS